MILTDNQIRELVFSDRPLIEDFNEESLQSESYDLSIGDLISRFDSGFKIVNLDQQESIDDLYFEQHIPQSGYLIGPKEYLLVSIKEKINIPSTLTAHIRPKTKFTRIGLLISGQHCNSSYSGNLSLGMYNATGFAICIKPGMKIAQIVFEQLCASPSEQKLYCNKKNAVFQNEESIRGSDFRNESRQDNSTSDMFETLNSKPRAKELFNILMEGFSGAR